MTTQPSGTERNPLSANVLKEFQLALFLLLLCLCDLRDLISLLVVASDASESGMGVCRTSTLTPQPSSAQKAKSRVWSPSPSRAHRNRHQGGRNSEKPCKDAELPLEYTSRLGRGPLAKDSLQMAWPAVIFGEIVEKARGSEISNIVRKATQVNVWTSGAQPKRKRELQNVMRLAGILRGQCAGATVAIMVQAPMSLPAGAVVAAPGIFDVKPLVIGPWPPAELDLPRLYWLSWQIRGEEGCTVQCAQADDRFHLPLPQDTATRDG